MYIKLILRGLLRHRQRGRRLFILMALCSAALIFLFTFRADFTVQYRDQIIGLETTHLKILPADSPLLSNSDFFGETEEVPLLRLKPEIDQWIRSLPEVRSASPLITRFGYTFNLDSNQESWVSLIAVRADRFKELFPLATVIEGERELGWEPSMSEVPVLKARLQTEFGDRNPDTTTFERREIITNKDKPLENFITAISADFPEIFTGFPYSGDAKEGFFTDWAKSLTDAELYTKLPPSFQEDYNWRLDDAIYAITENTDPRKITFLNKRLFQALYPDDIYELWEPIIAGKQVTIQVAPFTSSGPITMPVAIPARYAGMCEIIPLYTPNSYIDIDAFRYFLGLEADTATAYAIRLKDIADTDRVRALIEEKLKAEGLDAVVTDWSFLGKMPLTTGTAFSVVISILVVIFVVIVLIFTINLVLLSLIQRRREIGTSLAMGLEARDTIIIMTGEVGLIVAVSCAAGSLLALFLVLLAQRFGIPGMIFFPGSLLHLSLQAAPFIHTALLLIPLSMLIALIPLFALRKAMPVDLFREAS